MQKNIENLNAVVAAVQANNNVVGDDHNNGTRTLTLTGIGGYIRGEKIIPVALCNSVAFCLNEVYLDEEGKPRISRSSTGGLIELPGGLDLQSGIDNFNEMMKNNKFSNGEHLAHCVIFTKSQAA